MQCLIVCVLYIAIYFVGLNNNALFDGWVTGARTVTLNPKTYYDCVCACIAVDTEANEVIQQSTP